MDKKQWLVTIALNFTYEVKIECDEETADKIAVYPTDKKSLPPDILEKIEQAGDYGKLIEDDAEVIEVEEIEEF